MKIVVIGGTGLIGTKVMAMLQQQGHQAIAAAPSTGVNILSGEGLAGVMQGADVVIDLANSPSFEDKAVMDFFQTAGNNLLSAEKKAGVKHHLALSIVGTDKMNSGYMKAKVAQEDIIKQSGVPYTIIRSTQFFEFLQGIVYAAAHGGEVHLSTLAFQPIAADDVAAFVTHFALEEPQNKMVQIAGAHRSTLDKMVARFLQTVGDSRKVVANNRGEYFGAVHVGEALVPHEEVLLGKIAFENWLSVQKQGMA